jgi:hypothetical protein
MTNDATNHDAAALAPRQCASQIFVEVLLIVAVFFVATGDAPPHVNESHYLCRLKHYWNPSWCVGDLFLDSTDTQLVFIWLFGWVTKFASLTATAWIGRVVAWASIAWAWQRLSWRIVARRFAAVLSAALFIGLTYYLHMAGEWVVGGVEAKCFAYALVFWALRETLDGRWNRVWLLLGAATAFHPIVGGWSGVVCAGIWLIDGRREQSLASMLPGFIGGGLLGLIGVVPALMLTWGVSPDVVTESSRIYVFDRLPHHLAPLTLPTDEVTRRLSGHAVLLAVFVGFSFILWRMQVRSEREPQASGATTFTPYCALRRIELFALGAASLAAIGLAIELSLTNHPELAANLLRYYWFRMTDVAAAMAVALQLTALLAIAFERRAWWAKPALFAAIFASASYPVTACWSRVESPNSPSDSKVSDFLAWVEVCDWIKANTPPDALFLTPRQNLSFKWRTGRPEVVNRKDIPQDAAGIVAWHDRLKDIYTTQFGGVDQNVDSVGALGDDRVLELAKKYHAKFVLSDRGQLLSLPIAFENEEYVVYRVEDSRASD